MNIKTVVFRFEASSEIGAGHAVRSLVLADRLKKLNYNILIASSSETYDFIYSLILYKRINPDRLLDKDFFCDLLVIDCYNIDLKLEIQYRKCAKKIVVIDDLANRKHDCDVLLDQTYGRVSSDYTNLVPKNCKVLAGSSFILIRQDFLRYRNLAWEKRINTKFTNRILISLGGWVKIESIKKILNDLTKIGFSGEIDIVLGFSNQVDNTMIDFVNEMSNIVKFHINPNMAKLMYEADFAITASGSSVWERCYLGLPGVIIEEVENQSLIFNTLISKGYFFNIQNLSTALTKSFYTCKDIFLLCDGMGVDRVATSVIEDGLNDFH